MGDTITRAPDGAPLRWRDQNGAVHAVEGLQLVPKDPRTFAEWTRCGSADVPPEATWSGRDPLTCDQCNGIEAAERSSLRPVSAESEVVQQ